MCQNTHSRRYIKRDSNYPTHLQKNREPFLGTARLSRVGVKNYFYNIHGLHLMKLSRISSKYRSIRADDRRWLSKESSIVIEVSGSTNTKEPQSAPEEIHLKHISNLTWDDESREYHHLNFEERCKYFLFSPT